MIRILLADDQALIRGALAALLELDDDLQVVAQVGRGDEVLAAVESSKPDVALLDIEMPGLSGIDVAQQLSEKFPHVKTVIVTTFGRPGYLRRALDAGASGFVVKETPAEELAATVRTVMAGGRVVDPALAAESLFEGPNPLTDRERDVLRAALTGAKVSEIAAQLVLSEGTVRNHLSSAIGKTGADNRIGAALKARDNGWL
ncbi:MAG: response regulator transcription factor [Actinomycetaceae bacterium]|nr:response regulator transcription factor [Actinomycetaceae bacterium]